MSKIEEYLSCFMHGGSSVIPLLPLMHSCECFNARKILNERELKTQYCKVFGENLLYFYYGKPSYPVGEKVDRYRTDAEYSPVCFLLDARKVQIYKVYPFDSGAFFNDIYSDFFHRNMRINDFELPCTIEGINTYLSFMFGDNENYFDGIAIKRNSVGDPYFDALLTMMTAEGSMKFDERARTVEVISKENVQLKDALKCVILPSNLLRDANIKNFFVKSKIKTIQYKVRPLVHPIRYYDQIFELAFKYIEEQKELITV